MTVATAAVEAVLVATTTVRFPPGVSAAGAVAAITSVTATLAMAMVSTMTYSLLDLLLTISTQL